MEAKVQCNSKYAWHYHCRGHSHTPNKTIGHIQTTLCILHSRPHLCYIQT